MLIFKINDKIIIKKKNRIILFFVRTINDNHYLLFLNYTTTSVKNVESRIFRIFFPSLFFTSRPTI